MEQNVTKTPEWSNDLAHFHVEELEERLENGWKTGCPHTHSDGHVTYYEWDKANGPCPPDQGLMRQ